MFVIFGIFFLGFLFVLKLNIKFFLLLLLLWSINCGDFLIGVFGVGFVFLSGVCVVFFILWVVRSEIEKLVMFLFCFFMFERLVCDWELVLIVLCMLYGLVFILNNFLFVVNVCWLVGFDFVIFVIFSVCFCLVVFICRLIILVLVLFLILDKVFIIMLFFLFVIFVFVKLV